MLFILALLFFPCALVGAFVTGDDGDLHTLAFQAVGIGAGGGLSSSVTTDGSLHGGSSRAVTAAKDVIPTRRSSVGCSRNRRTPFVTMLVNDARSIPSIRSVGSSGRHETSNPDPNTTATTPPSSLFVWPAASAGGVLDDMLSRRNYLRGRAAANSENSDSALKAMSIPARCALPSVDLLREAYGPRRNFWGDLSARETRIFYKELLPVSIKLEALADRRKGNVGVKEDGSSVSRDPSVTASIEEDGGFAQRVFGGGGVLTLEEQARLASTARHAARLYARERCALPSRVVAHLYDGLRHLKNYGTFRVTGMTWEELWEKYEAQVRQEHPTLAPAELKERVCLRILEKSCCTSQAFDNIAGLRGRELEGVNADVNSRADSEVSSGATTLAAISANAARKESTSAASSTADAVVDDCRGEIDACDAKSKDLEQASALESAAAVAGVLRLTRLVKPFVAAKADATQRKNAKRRARRPLGKPRFSTRGSRPRGTV